MTPEEQRPNTGRGWPYHGRLNAHRSTWMSVAFWGTVIALVVLLIIVGSGQ